MIVVTLNPNQELEIIKYQKEFIKNSASLADTIYKNHLLWIPLSDENQNLKTVSSRIKTVTFSQPEIISLNNGSFNFDSNDFFKLFITPVQTKFMLFSKVTFSFTDSQQTFHSFLPLVFFTCDKNAGKNIDAEFLEKLKLHNKIPKELKVFKIAKALILSENTRALDDFVWKKLK